MTAQFFIAPDIYGPMLWHGDPDPEVDRAPSPRLSKRDLMNGPDDAVGAELWQLIEDAVARHSGAAKVHEQIAELRLLRGDGAA